MRDAAPSAVAAKAHRWSTTMSDSSDDHASQAAIAAAERDEQEKAEAAKLKANQERLLQKQGDDNARRQSLGGGSLS